MTRHGSHKTTPKAERKVSAVYLGLAVTCSKELFDPNRKVAKATAGCMKHGIGNGRRYAGEGYLAQALRAGAVELEIGLVDEFHVDGTDVRVDGQNVFGEVSVQETAVTRINFARLAERCTDPPNHATSDLA